MQLRKYLFLLGMCLLSASGWGQFNLSAGYSVGFMDTPIQDAIFEQFNENRPWLDSELKPFNVLNGVTLGARFRGPFFGLEVHYFDRFRSTNASGVQPGINRSSFDRKIRYRWNGITLGGEIHVAGRVSVGASFDYTLAYTVSSEVTGLNERFDALSEKGFLGNTFFINLQFAQSNNSAVAIRPYYQLPYEKINQTPLQLELTPESNILFLERENLGHIGVQIIFFNGRQRG